MFGLKKHVRIIPPPNPNTGLMHFNYRQFFSIILMALVDAQYRILYVDVGCYDQYADGRVFNSQF